MFYLADFLRTSSPVRSLSECSEGLLRRGKGGARIYRSFCNKTGSRNIKRLLSIKENQTSQDNEFRAFLCMGRCKSLDSLKSFL